MKPIIVVEGRDDTRRLKEIFPDIETIETQGSAINAQTLAIIKKAHEYRGVIVLTDPDFPGEKIRKIITQEIPTVQHAFLTIDEALPKTKGSLGVEHASSKAIKRALSDVKVVNPLEHDKVIDKQLLLRYGLVGGRYSKVYREKLSETLGIGYVNGKQLEKRLNMFGITQDRVVEEMSKILEDLHG